MPPVIDSQPVRAGKSTFVRMCHHYIDSRIRASKLMWILYDRPEDYPAEAIARMFVGGKPTDKCIRSDSITDLRGVITRNYPGLECFPRAAADFTSIVETWY